jgi:hypothetical protein
MSPEEQAQRLREAVELLGLVYRTWALYGIAPELEARIEKLLGELQPK